MKKIFGLRVWFATLAGCGSVLGTFPNAIEDAALTVTTSPVQVPPTHAHPIQHPLEERLQHH